ncbi:sirohydrochlorin chelatase [Dactylosporangium siamense]|uniref:Cobalamin biosynthesis protein n=1 Tax=Dactylosporangium siamense TaxID=685454 RepID=A0A919PM75_9ACTN|nr:CbiX/SirB N-terminal domain-containing protein [Dactylosporangium siamense]GIG46172.1 cobalamin biosynthesis protein [Dactylosporangium siamense]
MAHGSSDPRAAASTRALARAVAAQRPGLDVRTSYLDHAGPRPDRVLLDMQRLGHRSAVVVPLLLTSAFHGRVDLPAVIDRAHDSGLSMRVRTTDVLGPVGGVADPLLVAALRRQLPALDADGVVMVAAGTRDDLARHTVDLAATALGQQLGLPCRAAFASGSPITGAVAVSALRSQGCAVVAISSYFLATGRLHEAAVASAVSAGALAPAAPPLGRSLDLARLVIARIGRVAAPPADLAA